MNRMLADYVENLVDTLYGWTDEAEEHDDVASQRALEMVQRYAKSSAEDYVDG